MNTSTDQPPTPFAQTYFHGTKADLHIGDLIEAGYNSNFGKRKNAKYIFLTATLDAAIWGAELAAGEGKGRIYLVEPTGPLEDDPEFTGRKMTIKHLQNLALQNPEDQDVNSLMKDFISLGARENDVAHVRNWHHITCNNCLVENSKTFGKHVYLPTFGHGEYAELKLLDEHMKAMWENFDFTVHQLGDFNSFAKRQGVVHCITKYIKRSD